MERADQGAISFASDIRPLFRESDRRSMLFRFDLWSYDDVRANAEPILGQLEEGAMPCDDTWPDDQVELFRRWVETGSAP